MDSPTIANVIAEDEIYQRKKGKRRPGGDDDEQSKGGWKGAGHPPDVYAEASIPVAWSVSLISAFCPVKLLGLRADR
jgi:hypothetical protein